MEPLSKLFGKSKQAYYKYDENVVLRKAAREAFVIEYVRGIRAIDPGIGGPKLWLMYKREFGDNDTVGRDTFEDILDRNNLKVRIRIRKPKTTDSRHGLPTFLNLTKELIPTRPNQLWVSDITYIPIWVDDITYIFCYLSLILDAYTEEIIGWSVGPTLETVYPLEALEMALKRLDALEKIDLIHHSDRGVQYASSEYVHLLQKNHIKISMTETGDPKENAQAERINNTMKNELLKGKRFTDIDQVRAAVAQAVDFYNLRRPHMSINMMTPAEAAFCEGVLEKWWISYREKAVRAILERHALESDGKTLSLSAVPGSPSGLRPPVNPGTR